MTADSLPDSLRETLRVFEGSNRGTPLTTSEVADHLDIGRRSAYARLERLVESGRLETKKVGARGRVWWNPGATRTSGSSGIAVRLAPGERGEARSLREGVADPDDGANAGNAAWREHSGGRDSLHADLWTELRAASERTGDGLFGLNEELRFVAVDERAASLLGRSERDLLGAHVSEPFGEESAVGESLRAVLERGEQTTFETHFEPLDTWLEIRAFPVETGLSVGVGDVTERRGRERRLEESERRYRTLIENFPNGLVALFDEDLRYLVCGGELYDVFGRSPEDAVGKTLYERGTPDGIDALEPAYRAALDGESRSFETDYRDRTVQFRTSPVTDGEGSVIAGMVLGQDITDRVERERRLERQREQLTALNNLHDVVNQISQAVVEQSTREEIEEIVCRRLAESDSYLFAWIGEVDAQTRTVTVRTEAGVEGCLDDVTISVTPDDERSHGPTGRAVLRREMQVNRDVHRDGRFDPWCDSVSEYGFRSSAAIPIVHEDALYGVLNVYADRPNAFSEDEGAVIGQLGEVIGLAIAAVERKRALMGDEVVELEFRTPSFFSSIDVPLHLDGTIEFERTVPLGDGNFLEYCTGTGNALEVVDAVVESELLPFWKSVTVLERTDEAVRFELTLTEPPVLSTVAAQGGYIREARVEGGNYYTRIHLSPDSNVRRFVDLIADVYPGIELVAHRQVARDQQPVGRLRNGVFEELTERQRSALEAAYLKGYFAWPREASGEAVAASLNVSSTTFHQHLRIAERKLLSVLFAESPPPE